MKNSTSAVVYACIAVLSWSTVATAFKIALTHLTHFEMLLIASCTSLVIFALLLTFQKKWRLVSELSGRQWGYFALLGLLESCRLLSGVVQSIRPATCTGGTAHQLCMAYCTAYSVGLVRPSAHTTEEIYRHVHFAGWSGTYICRYGAVGRYGHTCAWLIAGSIERLSVGYVLDDKQ